MSGDLLRRAAGKLRGLVAALPVSQQADWQADGAEIYAGPSGAWVAESLREHAADKGEPTAAYIVGMRPIVALKLVDWLESTAKVLDDWLRTSGHQNDFTHTDEAAVAVARAILREPS